jgi:predicted TIM-barrel fold metal-dependent hydrolase
VTDDIRVIDADGHVEPAIAVDWARYMPAAYAAKLTAWARRAYDLRGDLDALRRGAWEARARLADMDAEGIEVAVVFGGIVGLNLSAGSAPEYNRALARGYNDWLADYCATDPARLKGVPLLAVDEIGDAVAELRRTVTEYGFLGAVLRPRYGERSIGEPYFDPLYAEAEALDVPVLVHGPNTNRNDTLLAQYHTHIERHALDFPLAAMAASMDVFFGGVLERFPRLRIGFLEAGAGWLPYWIDRLDEHFELKPHHVPRSTQPPSALMAGGRVYVSCDPDEKALPYVVERFGDDCVLYASDYPHFDSRTPETVRLIRGREDLAEESRRKILGENARRFFGARLEGGSSEVHRERALA